MINNIKIHEIKKDHNFVLLDGGFFKDLKCSKCGIKLLQEYDGTYFAYIDVFPTCKQEMMRKVLT